MKINQVEAIKKSNGTVEHLLLIKWNEILMKTGSCRYYGNTEMIFFKTGSSEMKLYNHFFSKRFAALCPQIRKCNDAARLDKSIEIDVNYFEHSENTLKAQKKKKWAW